MSSWAREQSLRVGLCSSAILPIREAYVFNNIRSFFDYCPENPWSRSNAVESSQKGSRIEAKEEVFYQIMKLQLVFAFGYVISTSN